MSMSIQNSTKENMNENGSEPGQGGIPISNQVIDIKAIDKLMKTDPSQTYCSKFLGEPKKTNLVSIKESTQSIDKLYRDCGYEPPLKYVFCSSPLALAIIYQYYEKFFQTDPGDIDFIPVEDFRNIPIESLVNLLIMYRTLMRRPIMDNGLRFRPKNWNQIFKNNCKKKGFSTSKTVILDRAHWEVKGPYWSLMSNGWNEETGRTNNPIRAIVKQTEEEEKREALKLALNGVFSKISHGYQDSVMMDVSSEERDNWFAREFMAKIPDLYPLEKFDSLKSEIPGYDSRKDRGLLKILDSGAYCIFLGRIAFICDRYEEVFLKKNRYGSERLHTPTGPAVRYTDGFAGYDMDGNFYVEPRKNLKEKVYV